MNTIDLSNSEPIYSIGVAARKVGVAVPTLRLYEKEGLIVPYRTSTNRRLYSVNDLRIVTSARELIQTRGLNFAGIRRLMSYLPCWKIRGCDPALYRDCQVPYITDSPCWSGGKASWRTCDGDCQSCRVYDLAPQIGNLSIYDFTRT